MQKETFIVKRVREVKLPTRSYELAAGFDFYIPDSFVKLHGADESVVNHPSPEYITIHPNSSIFLPSGIMIKMSPDWFMKFENKSGWAKKGLMVGCSIVDPDYQGEVHINLWNVSRESITVRAGEKIVQAIFYYKPNVILHEIERTEQLFDATSDRGKKGFGSSNRFN